LSNWREGKIDLYTSELVRLCGRGRANVDLCPRCGLPGPIFRCRDCVGGTIYCRSCIVLCHMENPLHRIYPGFFQKTMLSSLGLRIQLGHKLGDRCYAPQAAHKGFVVLHTYGIEQVNVDFCGCDQGEHAGLPEIQLLRIRWFPATHTKPRTCATMELLDRLREETLQAKTSMYDAYRVLERLTDNGGGKPADRYHKWIRMCREYTHALILTQSG
ncbi:hypothetical protein C8R46DRAFT_900428, partial [Mycena filopes]